METWRAIPGHPYYEASSLGSIRRKAGTPRAPRARRLKPRTRKTGLAYRDVVLAEDGKITSTTVHDLVATAFHGPRPSKDHEVAHLDDDPGNNRSANLEWQLRARNRRRGDNHPSAKITTADISEIQAIGRRKSQRRIGEMFGIGQTHVGRALRGTARRSAR